MEIIHLSVDTPMQVHDSVCALGFFDGVHLGHQQLLKEVEHIAKEKGLKKAIMTFSVHPKQILENNNYHYLMSLSEKINTAPGFQGIDSPIVKIEGGFIPDKNSRYFVEDIQFGLCIIKAFAELCNVETPTVDKIIEWGQKLVGKEYLVNGSLNGRDKGELMIPQAKGIKTKEELIKYYKNL